MIYLRLFIEFMKIGAVSLGGGYGMIALIREMVLEYEWMTESDFTSFIAISESTPGPLAVNMATFIGSSQGGIAGSLCATVGVVLPSFVIILLIAAIMHNLLKYKGVQAFLTGVRPCIVAMIFATGILMAIHAFCSVQLVGDNLNPDIRSIVVFGVLILTHVFVKKKCHQEPSPVAMIIVSALLGILLWSVR